MARTAKGSAHQRDGQWYARITLTREPKRGGRSPRVEELVTHPKGKAITAAYAKAYAETRQAAYNAGTWTPAHAAPSGGVTVGAWVDAWLSRQTYTEAVKDRKRVAAWLPRTKLAALPLASVTPRDVAAWLAELRGMRGATDKPPAPRTLRNVADPVARALRGAVFAGHLTSDPFAVLPTELRPQAIDADPVAASRRRMSRADVETLLSDEATHVDRRVLYALLALTGARMSEGAALRWCDIASDTPLPRVVIAEQWHQRLKERRGTKTGRGREVPLHPTLATVLAWWKATGWSAWYGRPPEPADLIVPSRGHRLQRTVGKVRRQAAVYREFQADLTGSGLPAHRVHDLRHTFVSLCADAGVAADVATRWTHTAGGSSARALYLVPSWARQCAEMLRLVVAAHGPWSNAGEPEGESNGAAR